MADSRYKNPDLIIGQEKKRKDKQVFVVSSSKYLNQKHSDALSELIATQEAEHDTFDDFVSKRMGMAYIKSP